MTVEKVQCQYCYYIFDPTEGWTPNSKCPICHSADIGTYENQELPTIVIGLENDYKLKYRHIRAIQNLFGRLIAKIEYIKRS